MDRDDPLESRRHFLRKLLATSGVAVTGSLLAPLVHAFGKVPHQLPAGTSIYDMQGKVMVDGKVANPGTRITERSLVQTATNSYVIFAVGQDAHIRLHSQRFAPGTLNGIDNLLCCRGIRVVIYDDRRTALCQFTVKPGFRGTPVSRNGFGRDFDGLGYLFHVQPPKEPELYHLALPGVKFR